MTSLSKHTRHQESKQTPRWEAALQILHSVFLQVTLSHLETSNKVMSVVNFERLYSCDHPHFDSCVTLPHHKDISQWLVFVSGSAVELYEINLAIFTKTKCFDDHLNAFCLIHEPKDRAFHSMWKVYAYILPSHQMNIQYVERKTSVKITLGLLQKQPLQCILRSWVSCIICLYIIHALYIWMAKCTGNSTHVRLHSRLSSCSTNSNIYIFFHPQLQDMFCLASGLQFKANKYKTVWEIYRLLLFCRAFNDTFQGLLSYCKKQNSISPDLVSDSSEVADLWKVLFFTLC